MTKLEDRLLLVNKKCEEATKMFKVNKDDRNKSSSNSGARVIFCSGLY